MRILFIALKDLSQILQQKKSALFLLIMPTLFSWILGILFNQNGKQDQRLPVAIVLHESGVLSDSLIALLENSDTIRPVVLENSPLSDLEEQVRLHNFAAAIVFPAGYHQAAYTGKPELLSVIVNKNEPAGSIADQVIQFNTTRLLGCIESAYLSLGQSQDDLNMNQRKIYIDNAIRESVDIWNNPYIRIEMQAQTSNNPSSRTNKMNGNIQSSAGMLVFFITVGMITPGYVLFRERRSGTLQRMSTVGLSNHIIIAGHVSAMFVIAFLQIILLSVFGEFFLGVNYWHSPTAILLLAFVLACWSACFGLLISRFSKTENHIVIMVLTSSLVFGLLGGAFFPLEYTDKTFALIGHLMPSAWAIDALYDILLRGAGIPSIWRAVCIIFLFSIAAFVISARRFQDIEK